MPDGVVRFRREDLPPKYVPGVIQVTEAESEAKAPPEDKEHMHEFGRTFKHCARPAFGIVGLRLV